MNVGFYNYLVESSFPSPSREQIPEFLTLLRSREDIRVDERSESELEATAADYDRIVLHLEDHFVHAAFLEAADKPTLIVAGSLRKLGYLQKVLPGCGIHASYSSFTDVQAIDDFLRS